MFQTLGKAPIALALSSTVLFAAAAAAIAPPADSNLAGKLFAEPQFSIQSYGMPISALAPELQDELQADLANLGAAPETAFYDARGGVWQSLVLSTPLVPGPGVGNSLTWSGLGLAAPADVDEYRDALQAAFESYLVAHAADLGIDLAELGSKPTVGVYDGYRLAHVTYERQVDGVPVRGSTLSATVNSGNLLLYGTRNWGPVGVSTTPAVTQGAAESAVAAHLAPLAVAAHAEPTRMVIVPEANGADPATVTVGNGYAYRLAWAVRVEVAGEHSVYEGLVDAHTGDLVAFTDLGHYLTRRTHGGILPVSNDGQVPDGVEQPRHPMPFADLTLADGSTVTTNSGGLADVDGPFSTALSGPYVRMVDNCGAISESTVCTDLDLGTNPGTDCDVPAFADSLGNTRSSRTGFYELNRLIEMVRSRVEPGDPAFAFVNAFQVPSEMNIANSCNAFFSPVALDINFYTSGTVSTGSGDFICRNTGEIAAVFDHEWGHFLDFMDGNALSSSSEGYADIVGILRLNDSCVGRGFWVQNPRRADNAGLCDGDGDPCLTCSGVRETDWKQRQAGLPHDVDWVTSSNPNVPGGCVGAPPPFPTPPPPGLSGAPCGGGVHCEGQIISESVVDLFRRDLRCHGVGWEDAPSLTGNDVAGGRCVGDVAPTLDENTALEIATLLFYRAKGNIQAWFQCSNSLGGCNADSGYNQFLAADDDNGLLADGTPHAEAIGDAFGRHQISCPATASAISNGGCLLGTPGKVQNLTATATVNGADLDWDDVPGAVEYWVYKTEGVLGCEIGKERVAVLNAALDGSSYSDAGLLDGLEYFYTVLPVGAPGCVGEMADCQSVVPLSAGGGSGGEASIAVSQDSLAISSGDGDQFLDNCEDATLGFTVTNNGGVDLTNVRVVDIRPASHPSTTVHTALPIALGSLGNACDAPGSAASASFDFTAQGLSHDDTLTFEVDVVADQLAGPQTGLLLVRETESDFVLTSEVSFTFESDEEGWQVSQGTFGRTNVPPPGAELTQWYFASSSAQDDACDEIRSPELILTATSTLSLHNQFQIEPQIQGTWYDRANVGIVDSQGVRSLITPDGGRAYNADSNGPGNFSGCTDPEEGWAGAGLPWEESTWSAAALGSATLAGEKIRISVKHGTDGAAALNGFQFDQVTVTDVLVRSPDQQSDVCDDDDDSDGDGSKGRVHGSGFLHTVGAGSKNLNFTFHARRNSDDSLAGKLKVNDRDVGVKIDAKTITSLSSGSGDCNGVSPGPTSFELTATGEFNGIAGAEFRVCGEDNGNPGKGDETQPPDRFFVECLSGCVYDSSTRAPDDGIDGGNIHIKVALASSASGESGGAADVTAVTLDPALLTEAPAGAPQAWVVTVSTRGDAGLTSVPVTLYWRGDEGVTESTSAVTDAAGVALFVTTVPSGDTVYWAEAGGLDSNQVPLAGI